MGQCIRPPKNNKHPQNQELDRKILPVKKSMKDEESPKKLGNESEVTKISNLIESGGCLEKDKIKTIES